MKVDPRATAVAKRALFLWRIAYRQPDPGVGRVVDEANHLRVGGTGDTTSVDTNYNVVLVQTSSLGRPTCEGREGGGDVAQQYVRECLDLLPVGMQD